jgi:UDP-glucose 4-epimerase
VLVAASDKARAALGWVPAYDRLEPILETALRWHRDQRF